MSEAVGEYQFAPNERPALPGGPFLPALSSRQRLEYGLTSMIVGIAATFPNSLIIRSDSHNTPDISKIPD
jgi:hypothetical protein